MAKKQRFEVLLDYLREQPGKRATLRQIHVDTWIQNCAEACRQARKKGFNITTEKDPDNQKVSSYVLHEEAKVTWGGKPVPPTKDLVDLTKSKKTGALKVEVHKVSKKKWNSMQAPLFPTNQRHYE